MSTSIEKILMKSTAWMKALLIIFASGRNIGLAAGKTDNSLRGLNGGGFHF